MRHKFVSLAVLGLLMVPMAAWAQQTGALAGRVVASDGSALPGVTVEALGEMLPAGRVMVTGETGDYRMAAGPDPRLAALIDDTIVGEPLDAAAEKAARDRAWQ